MRERWWHELKSFGALHGKTCLSVALLKVRVFVCLPHQMLILLMKGCSWLASAEFSVRYSVRGSFLWSFVAAPKLDSSSAAVGKPGMGI
jgi:hypothetical protein